MFDFYIKNTHIEEVDSEVEQTCARRNGIVGFFLSVLFFVSATISINLTLVGPKNAHGLSIFTIESVGHDGPTIWIGLTQVCSRPSENDIVTCTRSAGDETHTTLVTEKMATILQGVNGRPTTLAFLGLSTVFMAISFAILLVPICRSRGQALRTGKGLCPPNSFIALTLFAALLSSIAAIIESCIQSQASAKWKAAHEEQAALAIRFGGVYFSELPVVSDFVYPLTIDQWQFSSRLCRLWRSR